MAKPDQIFERRIVVKGIRPGFVTDLYYFFLHSSWTSVFLIIVAAFLLANTLFAIGYVHFGVHGARPGSLADAFFFSVQTMGTIGYGAMYPETTGAHVLVTIEALAGLLGTAMFTGLAFAKFSRPRARIIFSRHAVIAPRDGVPTLLVRVGNERQNSVVEAQMRISLVRLDRTLEGETIRRIIDLPLVRAQTPLFRLTWTGMHRVTPDSPLHGATPETVRSLGVVLLVTVVGHDETFAQTIHARHAYQAADIVWNQRHADVISSGPSGEMIVDYARFHEIEAAPSVSIGRATDAA